MTIELEQEFFKAFGVEPKIYCCKPDIKRVNPTFCEHYIECKNCDYLENKYPQTTDRILLQLIVIVTNYVNDICEMTDIEDLKKTTLEELIEISDRGTVKHQVQSLFREVEE